MEENRPASFSDLIIPRKKSSLTGRLVGLQSQSGRFGGQINILSLLGIELQFLDYPTRSSHDTSNFIPAPNITSIEERDIMCTSYIYAHFYTCFSHGRKLRYSCSVISYTVQLNTDTRSVLICFTAWARQKGVWNCCCGCVVTVWLAWGRESSGQECGERTKRFGVALNDLHISQTMQMKYTVMGVFWLSSYIILYVAGIIKAEAFIQTNLITDLLPEKTYLYTLFDNVYCTCRRAGSKISTKDIRKKIGGSRINSTIFIHPVVCLTTGPQAFPKRVLHRVRSSASPFNFQYIQSIYSSLTHPQCVFIPSDVDNHMRHSDLSLKTKINICNRCLFAIKILQYTFCSIIFKFFNNFSILCFNCVNAHLFYN
jgi:hypothetical protein